MAGSITTGNLRLLPSDDRIDGAGAGYDGSVADDRLIRERLIRLEDSDDRCFDIDFWQALGDAKIFAAAWELVVTAWVAKGRDPKDLRLDKSVERLIRRRSLPRDP